MSDIDKKVVQIDFDNKKFEKNVKQSQESLGELKKSLNFDNVSKSIDQVTVKISALEVATTTFIANLSNRIINLGIQMVKSLSIDNISSGWIKYGQKTTAVATMMAQSFKIAGKELTDQSEKMAAVTEQLERLSWFSDETSYTFTDMVDNVGKFIAAGQDLDVSVKAMEGIATWAALSGQNATTASRAMYQLSQAMGKGKIQLIDYKSIQNANMDTVEFRQTILETAVALGQLTKEGDKFVTKTGKKFTQSQFAEQLSSGWFTSEVLVKGLEKYSSAVEQIYALAEKEGKTATEIIEEYGDTLDSFGIKAFKAAQEARTFADVLNSVRDAVSSKWMTTSELIFGDKDQAVELWTSLSNALYDVFAEGGNFRNEILKIWNSLGGREDLFKRGGKDQGAFWNIYDAIIAVKDLIKSAWDTIFPLSEMEDESDQAQDIGNSLKSLTKRFQLFTKSLQMSSETSLRLRKIFEGIFSVLKFGLQVLQAVRFVLDPIFELGKKIITFVLDKLVALINSVNISGDALFKVSEKLNNILEKMFVTIKNGSGILGSIKKLIVNVGNNIIKFFEDLFNSFKSSNKLKSFFNSFITFVKNLFSNFKLLKPIFESIVKLFKDFVRILLNLPKTLNNISKSLTGNSIVDNIKKIFDSIAKTFNEFTESILSDKRLSGKMKALQPLSDLLKGILVFFKGILSIAKAAVTLVGKVLQVIGIIFQSIGDLVTSAFDGTLKLEEWQKSLLIILSVLAGIAIIFGLIINTIKNIFYSVQALVNPISVIADSLSGVLDKYAVKMIADSVKVIADSILEMTISLILIAGIDAEKLKRASIVVSVLAISLAGIASALIVISNFALKSKKAIQTTALAFKSTTDTIKNTFVGGISNIVDSFKSIHNELVAAQSVSMVLRSFSTALIKIAASFLIVSKLSWDEIGKGMTVLAGVLGTTLAIALLVGKKASDIAKAAPTFTEMLVFAGILRIFAKTLAGFKDFSKSQMGNVWAIFGLIELFLVSMSGIIILLNRVGNSWNAKYIINEINSMSLLLFSFGVTMKMLAKIDWKTAGVMMGIITGFIVSFLGLIAAINAIPSSRLSSPDVFKDMLAMSLLLFSFGVTISMLSAINWTTAGVTMGIIGGFVAEFAGLVMILSNLNYGRDSENIFPKIAQLMLSMSLMLFSFGTTMNMLKAIDWSTAGVMVGIIGIFFTEFAGLVGILTLLSSSKGGIATTNTIIKTISSMSLLLFSFGITVQILSRVPWDKTLGITGSIGLLLVSFGFMISLISKNAVEASIGKTLLPIFVSLAGMLLIFGYTIRQLSDISWDKLLTPLASMVVLFGSIGALFSIISRSSIDIAKSVSVLLALTSLSITLIAFGKSMKALASVPWQNILAATLPLIAVFGSLIGLEAAITAMGKSGAEILLDFSSIAIGITAVSGALLIFAKAFSVVSLLDLQTVGTGFLVLAGAIVIFAAGAKLLGPLSGQMLAVAASIMLVSVGLLLIVTALQMFASAVMDVTGVTTEQLQSSVESLGAIAETIADTVMGVINAIIEKIIEDASTIFSSIGNLIADSLDLVNTILPKVVEVLDTIMSLLGEYLPKFSKIILDVVASVITELNKNMSTIVSQVVDIFTKILNGLIARMDDLVVAILKFIKELLNSLLRNVQLINDITKSLVNLLVRALLGVAQSVAEVAGIIAEIILVFLTAALKLSIQSIGAVSSLMIEFVGGILLLFAKVAIGMNSVWYQLFRTIIYNVANVLFKLLTDLPSDFWNIIKTSFQSLWVGILRVFYDITKDIPFVGDWFKGVLEDAEKNLSNSKDNIEDIISGSNVEAAINDAKKNITDSIKNTTNSIKDTTKESLNVIKETIDDTKNDFNDIFQQLGESVGDGYQKGIDESSNSAINAASDMATKSSEAVAKANDSHSPSKVFEKLGMFTVLGYAKGINENTSKAINSMTFMAENALNAAQEILENQNGDDITLKVGLDISSVEGQAQKVSDIMTGINKVDASIYGQNAFYNAKVLKDTQKDKVSASSTSTSNVTYNNVFNITSTDPEESADEIDKALSKQAMRAKLAHGNI